MIFVQMSDEAFEIFANQHCDRNAIFIAGAEQRSLIEPSGVR